MSATREEIYKAVETLTEAIKTDEGKRIIGELNIKFEVVNDGEEWRDIEGYNGDYQVSNFGRVRSHKIGNEWRPLRRKHTKNGYLSVTLAKNGKSREWLVHVLVAKEFIENPNDLPIVEHRDNNKTNCHMDNLFWSTQKANNQHAHRDGLITHKLGSSNPMSKLTEESVKWIREHCIKGDREYGIQALARKFNINHATMCDIVNYKLWKHVK